MRRSGYAILLLLGPSLVAGLGGCRSRDRAPGLRNGDRASSVRPRTPTSKSDIRGVACLYDQKPWLNLDKAGDLDPEGIQYRVFLNPGTGRGVARDGVLHAELYRIDAEGQDVKRTLVSDWHYPTTDIARVQSKVLGMGYHLRLRWATKDLVGREVELVTRYEAPDGTTVAAGTKRFRVPKSGA